MMRNKSALDFFAIKEEIKRRVSFYGIYSCNDQLEEG